MKLTQELGRACTGYHKITGLNSAKGIPGVGGAALIEAEDNGVRYRLDGVAPTADTGGVIAAGEKFWIVGDLSKILFLEDAASAICHVHTFE